MRTRTWVAGAAVVVVAATTGIVLATTGSSSASDDGLSAVRQATAKYHDLSQASADGFVELKDTKQIACIVDDTNHTGTMGIHYVLLDRVKDSRIDATKPELVIYQPEKNGQMKLVAVEWVVDAQAWANAGNPSAPSLFGHTFTLIPKPNRYGLDPFFEMHAWVWDHNKSGVFADYNPAVRCG